jgi:hypothetical protein
MLLHLIPLVAVAAASNAAPAVSDAGMTERTAQEKLADMLGNADSIDSVHAHGHTIVFAVEHADATGYDAPFSIIATTDRNGKVIDVEEQTRAASDIDIGGLSWLADTMQTTVAVTKIVVDNDGAVTLTTADGQRYMAIPGRGSGGSNDEVEARWAAEFDNS